MKDASKFHANQTVSVLKGIGPKVTEQLALKNIHTLQDCLFLLPLRYEDRTRLTSISKVYPGSKVLLDGEILSSNIQFGKRRSLYCRLTVGTVNIGLRFYFFSKVQQRQFVAGNKIRIYGVVYQGASGLEIYHPEYSIYSDNPPALEKTLTPVYPTLSGVGQGQWRKLLRQIFEVVDDHSLDNYLQDVYAQDSFKKHLFDVHFPSAGTDLKSLENGSHPSQQALIVEELVAHYLARQENLKQRSVLNAAVVPTSNKQTKFLDALPFELTRAQKNACQDISHDLSSQTPMLRLLQGDVGSGKTLVAAWAALQVIAAGYQVAFMVPTEILAEQHSKSLTTWFKPFDVRIACLVGSLAAKKKKQLLEQLVAGDIDLLIGTHAIFQKDIHYHRLALVIIDEQHRFGVHQRLALLEKETSDKEPHQLIMTATPIPRTLAMSLYIGMDTSIINELPKGRQPIDTKLFPAKRKQELFERIAQACKQGRQVYWVCTLIENSELLDSQAVEDALQELTQALPQLRIKELHGKMKAPEKKQIMQTFVAGELDILIATTVIEVGIDVPNASIIVIENPERLGLAQLHQLRGRVGRGKQKSYCVLLHGEGLSHAAKERLRTMRQHQDGFLIAEEDLRLRGAGDYFGIKQSGELSMRIADVYRDTYLLGEIKDIVEKLRQQYPHRVERIIQRWLPDASSYTQV